MHIFLFFKKVFLFLKIIALFFNRFIKIHLYICRLHKRVVTMRKRRKFYNGSINHIYQKSADGNNLFYDYEDFLVFYTILSVCARSSDIKPLMLCIMYNHFHLMICTMTIQELSEFMDRVTSWYVMEFNYSIGRKGKLLKKNFGSAPKWNEKSVRTTINYIGNNPVEKHLCEAAEDYRWNFIAFIHSTHPFSESIHRDKASKAMRRALTEIDSAVELNIPLKHAQLRRIFRKLSDTEKEQIVDYIIYKYLPFDKEGLLKYYESYETMLTAMHSNSGNEYDIREEWYPESDTAYIEMTEYIRSKWPEKPVRSVIMISPEEKTKLANELKNNTSGSRRQIARFLHMEEDELADK